MQVVRPVAALFSLIGPIVAVAGCGSEGSVDSAALSGECALLSTSDCASTKGCHVVEGRRLYPELGCALPVTDLGCRESNYSCHPSYPSAYYSRENEVWFVRDDCPGAGWSVAAGEWDFWLSTGECAVPEGEEDCWGLTTEACDAASDCAPLIGTEYDRNDQCLGFRAEFGCRRIDACQGTGMLSVNTRISGQTWYFSDGCTPVDWESLPTPEDSDSLVPCP